MSAGQSPHLRAVTDDEKKAAEREDIITRGLAAAAEMEALCNDAGIDPQDDVMQALRGIREAGREPYALRSSESAGDGRGR